MNKKLLIQKIKETDSLVEFYKFKEDILRELEADPKASKKDKGGK